MLPSASATKASVMAVEIPVVDHPVSWAIGRRNTGSEKSPPIATPTGRYLGVVHFQRLLRELPSALLGGVVDNDIDPLEPATPLAEITRRMATYNLVCMPVVDSFDRLVGAVTVDDVLDHLLPPHWRDRDATAGAPAAAAPSAAPSSTATDGAGRG